VTSGFMFHRMKTADVMKRDEEPDVLKLYEV